MDRLLRMNKEEYVRQMRVEMERVLGEIADAVNDAPDGNVINGSEVQVRDLMAESVVSVGVRELCCRLGTAGGSFARAAANLNQAAQVKLSDEKFRQVVESECRAVLAAGQDEQLELDFSASDCKVKGPDGQEVSRLYGSCDEVLVAVVTQGEKDKRRATVLNKRRTQPTSARKARRPLRAVKRGADQRYKQFYLTAFYDQDQIRRLVGVTRKDHKGLGKLLTREASRVRWRGAQQRIGLIDGAPCLRRRMERLPLTALQLDFYHLSTHVHQGRIATFGEADTPGQQWAADLLHTVKHQGHEPFWEKLCDWRAKQRGGKRKAADSLLNYVRPTPGHDRLPDVHAKRLAHRQRPHRVNVQSHHATRQGMRHALGQRQRRSHDGFGITLPK